MKFKITPKLLRTRGACDTGIKDMRHFLRTPLSTSPDRNLPLAKRLINSDKAWRIWWALNTFVLPTDWVDFASATYNALETDPGLLAQALAVIADRQRGAA